MSEKDQIQSIESDKYLAGGPDCQNSTTKTNNPGSKSGLAHKYGNGGNNESDDELYADDKKTQLL